MVGFKGQIQIQGILVFSQSTANGKMLGKTGSRPCPSSWQLSSLLLEFPRVPKMGIRGRDESVAFLTCPWRGPSLLNWTSPLESPGYGPSSATVGTTPCSRAQGGTSHQCASQHICHPSRFPHSVRLNTCKEGQTEREDLSLTACLCFCVFFCSAKAWLFILFRVTLRHGTFCWWSYKSPNFQC